jgi:hypothetical protein
MDADDDAPRDIASPTPRERLALARVLLRLTVAGTYDVDRRVAATLVQLVTILDPERRAVEIALLLACARRLDAAPRRAAPGGEL